MDTAAHPAGNGASGTTLISHLLDSLAKRSNYLEEGVIHTNVDSSVSKGDSLADLVTLLSSITLAVKTVGSMVRRMGLPQAEAQSVADINKIANDTWIRELTASDACCVLVSEDLNDPVVMEERHRGNYAVVFDPLTGLADPPAQDMGAIFGVFRQLTQETEPGVEDVLQPARNLIAAGYAVYGAATMVVLSYGSGVHGFTLDPTLSEFILTHENMQVPYSGRVYAINEGFSSKLSPKTQQMLKALKDEPALDGSTRTCRYIGSMVPELHRTIIRGGVYIYPAHEARPQGRLKLLYEAGPLAFVVEKAGGQASTGTRAILDIQPESLHHRVEVYTGSEDDINLCTSHFRKAPWGRGPSTDPMYSLRRKRSIDAQMKAGTEEADSGGPLVHSPSIGAGGEDGFVCAYLPVV